MCWLELLTAILRNKKVKQRADLGSAWTQPTAGFLESARSWRLSAPGGLS